MAYPHPERGWLRALGGTYLKSYRNGTTCRIRKRGKFWIGNCANRRDTDHYGCDTKSLAKTKRCLDRMVKERKR